MSPQTKMLFLPLLSFFVVACKGKDGKQELAPVSFASSNYSIEQRISCFCAAPAGQWHKLTVINGEITRAVEVQTGKTLPPEKLNFFKTIEDLMDFVAGVNPDSVAVFDLEIDPEHGYPSRIYVDFDERLADEEVGFENRHFSQLAR